MGATQLDSIRRQAEAEAHRAASGAEAGLRRESSLVSQASQLAGKAVRQEEKVLRTRIAGKGRPSFQPAAGGEEEHTQQPRRPAPDGYMRRSPVQPVREREGYHRRMVFRAVGTVLFLAVLLALLWLVLRTGILAF